LGRVRLGGGDTNLGTGIDVNTTVGHQGDARADDINDSDGQSTTLETVAQRHERVSRLAGLRNKHASVVAEHGRLTVEEVGRQFD
jgi:hypothetical protein